MPATYTFDVDSARDMIIVTMAGFFALADIAEFRSARASAHLRLTCGLHQHRTLVDLRGMQIQSRGSVASFSLLLEDQSYRSQAIAFVVSQSLARMQIERAAARRDVGYFTDLSYAKRWLTSCTAR